MTTLLFYKELVFLNREIHKELKFKVSSNYSFSAEVNSVPLTGIEFFDASRDMPVLFSKDNEGNYFPLALLSLMEKGHSMINHAGEWGDSYIPAFIRRYPFVLIDDGTVCFDQASGLFDGSDGDGELLFNSNGENTEVLDNIIRFLNNYDLQHKTTYQYCKECANNNLIIPYDLQIQIDQDEPVRVDGLYIISEEKLAELDKDTVDVWFRRGWLAWTYAHLHSLGAINRLLKRQQKLTGHAQAAGYQ